MFWSATIEAMAEHEEVLWGGRPLEGRDRAGAALGAAELGHCRNHAARTLAT
jgi:hypothetical protein